MNTITVFSCFLAVAVAYNQPNCEYGRTVIVHLFNWKWTDIARECEDFLGPMGYCGVQVSPPNEHRIVGGRPWWERYQPVSYKLVSRSGDDGQFRDMVNRCNAVGVKIYIDAVINHMCGVDAGSGTGTAGSWYDTGSMTFDGVPYGWNDFNSCGCGTCCSSSCNIESYGDANQVRNCRLVGLADLALGSSYVRGKVADFLRYLLDIGVAGFRVDACKHMWPGDLQAIYQMVGGNPFIFNEVIDMGGEAIGAGEYTHLGRITEFKYCNHIGQAFRKHYALANLKTFGESWGMLADGNAFVFVDNHDNQRGHGAGGDLIITHKEPGLYKKAVTFMLAWPYGFTRVMSSYYWSNTDEGPPSYGDGIADVIINGDGTCGGGWVCEHRWRQIANMVTFRNVANGQPVSNWWDNGNHQLAFSRGNKAFYAISNEGDINEWLSTGMPEGTYCDIISGSVQGDSCTGKSVYVASDGRANIVVNGWEEDSILAFHELSRVGSGGGPTPTSGPTPAPTPPPSGWTRTVVFLRQPTTVGQDLFIRGGISHGQRPGCTENAATSPCAISITYNSLGTSSHWDGYNAWRVGDTKLDWYGREAAQGSFNGVAAEGSATAWTSNQASSPGYNELNKWGEHYWMIDMNMDCDAAEEGWFELKGFVTNGPGWENNISQTSCGGTSGGSAPYQSENHMAKCGKINVFEWNSSGCTINNF